MRAPQASDTLQVKSFFGRKHAASRIERTLYRRTEEPVHAPKKRPSTPNLKFPDWQRECEAALLEPFCRFASGRLRGMRILFRSKVKLFFTFFRAKIVCLASILRFELCNQLINFRITNRIPSHDDSPP